MKAHDAISTATFHGINRLLLQSKHCPSALRPLARWKGGAQTATDKMLVIPHSFRGKKLETQRS